MIRIVKQEQRFRRAATVSLHVLTDVNMIGWHRELSCAFLTSIKPSSRRSSLPHVDQAFLTSIKPSSRRLSLPLLLASIGHWL